MIEKYKLTTEKASGIFLEISSNPLSFGDLNAYDQTLRKELLQIHADVEILGYSVETKPYQYDLMFGLKLYELLNSKYQLNERMAAQDNIWRYIAIYLMPDIIAQRFGWKEERFYKSKRRIWPKSIWWYVHLSWQGSLIETFTVLEKNSTDEIVQLVERAGSFGYRIDFSRELMKQFSMLSNAEKKNGLFRKLMKLNTMRVRVVEPSLLAGGNEQYVKNLITYFSSRKS